MKKLTLILVCLFLMSFIGSVCAQEIEVIYNKGPLRIITRNPQPYYKRLVDCEVELAKEGLDDKLYWADQAANALMDYYPVGLLLDAFSWIPKKGSDLPKKIVYVGLTGKFHRIWKKCDEGRYGEVERGVLIWLPSWEFTIY